MTSKKEKSKERRDGLIYFLEELRNAADTVIDYTAEAKISFARHVTKEKKQFKELVQYLQPRLLHKILEREGDHHERILNFVLSLPAINQSLLLREFADEERESVLEGCEEGKKQQINENLARLKLIENSEQDQKIPLTSRDDPGSSDSSQVHVALAAKTTNTKQPGTSSAKTGAASSEVVRKKEGNNGDKGRRGKSSNDSSDESSKENNQENHKKGGEESRDDKTDESSTDESSTDESSADESSSEVIRKKEGNNGDKGRRGKSSNDSSDESSKENNQENHKKGGEESRDDKTDESSTDESSSSEEEDWPQKLLQQ